MHCSKGRATENEKKDKTNLWNTIVYEYAFNFIKDAGIGGRTG